MGLANQKTAAEFASSRFFICQVLLNLFWPNLAGQLPQPRL